MSRSKGFEGLNGLMGRDSKVPMIESVNASLTASSLSDCLQDKGKASEAWLLRISVTFRSFGRHSSRQSKQTCQSTVQFTCNAFQVAGMTTPDSGIIQEPDSGIIQEPIEASSTKRHRSLQRCANIPSMMCNSVQGQQTRSNVSSFLTCICQQPSR